MAYRFLLALVPCCLFFIDIGNTAFFYHDDEWLYIQIASEMFDRGEFWIPYWMGTAAYYKPPLVYWLMMLLFPFGADRVILARTMIAMFSCASVWLVYGIGKNLYGEREAMIAAFLTCTCFGFIGMGRVGMMDVPYVFLMILSIYFLVKAWKTSQANYIGLFFIIMGLSCLVRGPVSGIILFLVGLVMMLLSFRKLRPLFFSAPSFIGAFLGLCLVFLWPAAIYLKGDFANWWSFFILGENFGKFSEPGAYPAISFMAAIFKWLAPWSLLLLAAFILLLLHHRLAVNWNVAVPLVWSATNTLVHLIPDTRLPWYMFPAVPPATLLLGFLLCRFEKSLWFSLAFRTTAVIFLGPLTALGLLAWAGNLNALQLLFIAVAVVATGWIIVQLWRKRLIFAMIGFAVLTISVSQIVPGLVDERLPDAAVTAAKSYNASVAAVRIESGRLSQQLWYYSYRLQKKVALATGLSEATSFLGQNGLVIISQTDLMLLRNQPATANILILAQWIQWKDSVDVHEAVKALTQRDLSSLKEYVYLVQESR